MRLALVLAVALWTGCGQDKVAPPQGMPAAEGGELPAPVKGQVEVVEGPAPAQAATPGTVGAANPHAGVPGAPGGPGSGNPPVGAGDPANPHGGSATGAPRPVDPSKVLSGSITVNDTTKGLVKPGDVIFLTAKRVDEKTGEPVGGSIAVARVDVSGMPLPFALTGADVLMPNAAFDGRFHVEARVDRDSEARTREPGDVEGVVIATVPSQGLELVLDTVVQ